MIFDVDLLSYLMFIRESCFAWEHLLWVSISPSLYNRVIGSGHGTLCISHIWVVSHLTVSSVWVLLWCEQLFHISREPNTSDIVHCSTSKNGSTLSLAKFINLTLGDVCKVIVFSSWLIDISIDVFCIFSSIRGYIWCWVLRIIQFGDVTVLLLKERMAYVLPIWIHRNTIEVLGRFSDHALIIVKVDTYVTIDVTNHNLLG